MKYQIASPFSRNGILFLNWLIAGSKKKINFPEIERIFRQDCPENFNLNPLLADLIESSFLQIHIVARWPKIQSATLLQTLNDILQQTVWEASLDESIPGSGMHTQYPPTSWEVCSGQKPLLLALLRP